MVWHEIVRLPELVSGFIWMNEDCDEDEDGVSEDVQFWRDPVSFSLKNPSGGASHGDLAIHVFVSGLVTCGAFGICACLCTCIRSFADDV